MKHFDLCTLRSENGLRHLAVVAETNALNMVGRRRRRAQRYGKIKIVGKL